MIDIDEAIKRLTEIWRYEHTDKYTDEEIRETIDLAIDTLKQKQWMIDEYDHEVDLLEQDLNDNSGYPTVTDVVVPSAKLGVYKRVLKDLKGDGEE